MTYLALGEKTIEPKLRQFVKVKNHASIEHSFGLVVKLRPTPHEHQGSISSTCFHTAFTHEDPKSKKKMFDMTVFFALLGYLSVKVASKMMVKLTPGWKNYEAIECCNTFEAFLWFFTPDL